MQKGGPAGSDNADGVQSSQSLEPQDERYEFIDANEEFEEPPLKSPFQTTDFDEQPSCKGDLIHQYESKSVGEKVSVFSTVLAYLVCFPLAECLCLGCKYVNRSLSFTGVCEFVLCIHLFINLLKSAF